MGRHLASWRALVTATALLGATAGFGQAAPYTLVDLGVPAGAPAQASVSGAGLNNQGVAVGNVSSNGNIVPFVYSGGVTSLVSGGLAGAYPASAFVWGVSPFGAIFGNAEMTAQNPLDCTPSSLFCTQQVHAFVVQNGVWSDLTPTGLYVATASGVNTGGLVVVSRSIDIGIASGPSPLVCDLVSLAGAAPLNIGTIGSPGVLNPNGSCFGAGVNALGQVTGTSASVEQGGPLHAFLYSPSSGAVPAVMEDLGTLPGGTQSTGVAVNDQGQVAGWSGTDGAFSVHAFLYTPGVGGGMQDLGALPNGSSVGASLAYGLNNGGAVVGSSEVGDTGQAHGFLYASGALFDLNTLIAPSAWGSCFVTLVKGNAINDTGLILADGVESCSGVQHAYLLQPPSPVSPSNPCGPVGVAPGIYLICKLPPFVAVCGEACALHYNLPVICPACQTPLQVVWSMPGLASEHWADGAALQAFVTNIGQARSLAMNLKLTLSTEAEKPPGVRLAARAGLLTTSGGLATRPATIVAPVVEIAAAADGAALARDLVGSRGAPFIRLSLPFHQTADAARIRLARFDDASGVWTEVPGLTIRTSTSVISGRVQLAGRYTVVQAAADAVP